MPVINRIAALAPEIAAWRQDIHAHPEVLFDTHRTSALVAGKLRGFGCDEVVTGLGRTGVVGVIRGRHQSAPQPRAVGSCKKPLHNRVLPSLSAVHARRNVRRSRK